MKELIVGFQVSLLWLCAVAIIALAVVTVSVNIRRAARAARRRLRGPAVAVMAAVAVACTLFARKGSVSVSAKVSGNTATQIAFSCSALQHRVRRNPPRKNTATIRKCFQARLRAAGSFLRIAVTVQIPVCRM